VSDTQPRRPPSSPASSRRRDRLLGQLGDLGQILRGTLAVRYRRCGRSNCHCARAGDPGHGPAYYLVATLAPGRTVQVYVPRRQKEAVEAWLENFRRAQRKLDQIATLNRDLLKKGTLFRDGP
jgi:hypothetical protein